MIATMYVESMLQLSATVSYSCILATYESQATVTSSSFGPSSK